MSEDQWAETWTQLTRAVERAYESGWTEQEILDAVDEARPGEPDEAERQPKPKR